MRDIIWTVVVIWLVYKLVEVVRQLSKPKNPHSGPTSDNTQQPIQSQENEIRKAVKNHLDKAGEYVDFEETK